MGVERERGGTCREVKRKGGKEKERGRKRGDKERKGIKKEIEGVRERERDIYIYREEERREKREKEEEGMEINEERMEKERGRVFLVCIKQLNRSGMSIPQILTTVYFVHTTVVLCEITSARNTCKTT